MLFTPKKYGRNWTRALGIGFSASALVFAISLPLMLFGQFDNLPGRLLAVIGFTAAAIVLGMLGRGKWSEASKMPKDSRHKR